MKIESSGATHVGRKREGNEDSFLIDESVGLYIVCDGMGGHAAGEVASRRSIAYAAKYIRDRSRVIENAGSVPGGYSRVVQLVEDAVQFASANIYQTACSDETCRGMGSTMTMLVIVDNKAILGHVGDSRLYVLRGGIVHQLSTDHTLGNELATLGTFSAEGKDANRYSHILTRVIGSQELVQVETLLFDLFPDDLCLLCSDGLSNYLSDPSLVNTIVEGRDVKSSATALLDFANGEGGSDNITTIVLRAMSDVQVCAEVAFVKRRLKALSSSFLGKRMSASRVMRLLNASAVVIGSAGQTITSVGDQNSGVYFVVHGRMSVAPPERPRIEIEANGWFGQTALAGSGTSSVSAKVIEDVELLYISRKRFSDLARRIPKLGRLIYRNLADELCRNLLALQDDDTSDTWLLETSEDVFGDGSI